MKNIGIDLWQREGEWQMKDLAVKLNWDNVLQMKYLLSNLFKSSDLSLADILI